MASSAADLFVDVLRIPEEIRIKLAQLDLELSEGDITEKGYEKKRKELLQNFMKKGNKNKPSDSKEEKARRHRRRMTRNESRFHSEIRQEAVQQALAEWGRGEQKHEEADGGDDAKLNVNSIRCSFRPIRRRNTSKMSLCKNQTDSSSSEEENGQNSSTLDSGTGGSKDRKAKGPKGKKEAAAANGKKGIGAEKEGGSSLAAAASKKEDEEQQPGCSSGLATKTNLAMKNDIGTQMENVEKEKIGGGSENGIKKNMAERNGGHLEGNLGGIRAKEMVKSPIKIENGGSRLRQQLPPKRRNPAVGAATAMHSGPKETPASANRTSVLVLEDRSLPPLPPTDDDEEEDAENGHQPEPAVYVNSTNDSGLGGSSNAPQDYANTRIPLKPARVSQKIQQVLLSLQPINSTGQLQKCPSPKGAK